MEYIQKLAVFLNFYDKLNVILTYKQKNSYKNMEKSGFMTYFTILKVDLTFILLRAILQLVTTL